MAMIDTGVWLQQSQFEKQEARFYEQIIQKRIDSRKTTVAPPNIDKTKKKEKKSRKAKSVSKELASLNKSYCSDSSKDVMDSISSVSIIFLAN